jgi:putative ABC transport system permease protein
VRLLFQLAWRNFVQGGRRVWLLAAAFTFAAFVLVLVTGLFGGMSNRLIHGGTAVWAGHVNVGGFYSNERGTFLRVVRNADGVADLVRQQLSGVDSVSVRQTGWAQATSATSSLDIPALLGVDIAREPHLRSILAPAAGFGASSDIDALARPGTIVLFKNQAARLNVAVGESLTLVAMTDGGAVNTADVTVVAVAKDLGQLTSWVSFVNRETLRVLLQQPPGSGGMILAYLDDVRDTDAALSRLQKLLAANGHELLPYVGISTQAATRRARDARDRSSRLVVSSWRNELDTLLWRLAAADGIRLVLFAVMSLLIAVGVINAMLVTVRQRTREIGTLRALGLSSQGVLLLFLSEGLLLGGIPAVVGSLAGSLVARILNLMQLPIGSEAFRTIYYSDVLYLHLEPASVLLVTAGIAATGGLSCLWPALRAARLRPTAAIRMEE